MTAICNRLVQWIKHQGIKGPGDKGPGLIEAIDALIIAATALTHGLTLATRNTADFSDTGIDLINPWE